MKKIFEELKTILWRLTMAITLIVITEILCLLVNW